MAKEVCQFHWPYFFFKLTQPHTCSYKGNPELYSAGRLSTVYKPHSFWVNMAEALYQVSYWTNNIKVLRVSLLKLLCSGQGLDKFTISLCFFVSSPWALQKSRCTAARLARIGKFHGEAARLMKFLGPPSFSRSGALFWLFFAHKVWK